MDFKRELEEFKGASDMLRSKAGVTSLEQLVRDTKKKDKQKAKQEAVKEQAARESLESPEDDDPMADGMLPAVVAEPDHPEPEATQQCLFLELAEPTEHVQLADSHLQRACTAPEADADAGTAAELERQDAVRQLLVGGALAEHCRVAGSCSASTAQELLDLMVTSPDLTVASTCLDAFVAILGQQLPCNPLAQPVTADAACSAAFDGPNAWRECELEWLPGDEALLNALHQCGYRSPGAAGSAAPRKSPSKGGSAARRSSGQKRGPDGSDAGQDEAPDAAATAAPLVARLRLLLRFIPALCAYDQEHGGARRRGGLRPAGLQRLVAALLRLRLDPAGAALSPELQAAVQALLGAWPSDKEWAASLPALAADASQLGPNHGAHLAALQGVPPDSARGAQLRAAAAALLLTRLVPPPNSKLKAAAPPDLANIDAQAVVQGLWWQEHNQATKKAAQAAFKGTAKFDVWELDTAVRAADLLLWPPTLALAQRSNAGQAQEGDGEATKYIRGAGWHSTLRTLHTELRNVAGGWQLAAIRLAGHVDCIDQRNRLVLNPGLG